MFSRLITRIVLPTAAMALLLTGCGGGQEAVTPNATGSAESSSAPTSSGKAKPGIDAKQDVKIASCVANSYTQDVTIEVTNSTAEVAKYVVGIDISGPDGKPASEARFVKNRIEAGKTLTERIPGDTPIKGAVTCAIGEARRLPAQ